MKPITTSLALFLLGGLVQVNAQFHFDNIFGGFQKEARAQNGKEWYESQYRRIDCQNNFYQCPDTLACVQKPVDCPTAWSGTEDQCTINEGLSVKVSKHPGQLAGCQRVEALKEGIIF